MNIKEAFASALKQARVASKLTQEDFSEVSSRTYVSTLERGLKNPTLDKIEDLASVMKIHPLTLITLAYKIKESEGKSNDISDLVTKELNQVARL